MINKILLIYINFLITIKHYYILYIRTNIIQSISNYVTLNYI